MVNDPQANDLLRLRLMRGYGMAYLNGTDGEALYIQGGYYYTKNDFNGNIRSINWLSNGWAPNDRLFKISLNKPWGAQVASYNNLLPRTTVYNNPSSGPGQTSEYGAVLSLPKTSGIGVGFGALVSVGGGLEDGSRGDIWTFTGEDGSGSAGPKSTSRFSAVNVTNPNDFKAEFGGSTVGGDGRVWWLGGSSNATDAGGGESKLLWFHPKSGESGSYPGSGAGTLAPTGSNWVGQSMVWVPAGEKGMLIAMGGAVQKSTTTEPVQMNKVGIFDIATEKWYTQTTAANPASPSGGIPGARQDFCTATPRRAGSQPGVQNWEIFFYGGLDQSHGITTTFAAKDDFWALSIPSFTWTRIWSGNDAWFGKWARSCVMMNDVFYGFVDIATTGTGSNFNRSTTPLLSFFDVTGTTFVPYTAPGNSKRTYSTPLLVQSGVDQTGNKPPGGFTPGLDEVFAAAERSTPSSAKKRHTGAIAGGVVGLIAILAIIGLGFFFWRRRKNKKGNRFFKDSPPAAGTMELEGNAVNEVHGNSVPGSFATGKERYAKVPIRDEEHAPPVELPTHEATSPDMLRPVAELQG